MREKYFSKLKECKQIKSPLYGVNNTTGCAWIKLITMRLSFLLLYSREKKYLFATHFEVFVFIGIQQNRLKWEWVKKKEWEEFTRYEIPSWIFVESLSRVVCEIFKFDFSSRGSYYNGSPCKAWTSDRIEKCSRMSTIRLKFHCLFSGWVKSLW